MQLPPADQTLDVVRRVDGDLGDEVWQSAAITGGFGQVEPVSGAAPSEMTEMRIFSTASALYIGVRCYDSEPDQVLARDRRRDSPGRGDDRVRMVFDTFGQARNGYYFAVAGGGGKVEDGFKIPMPSSCVHQHVNDCIRNSHASLCVQNVLVSRDLDISI